MFGQVENIAISLKNMSQKLTALVFGNKYIRQNFTEYVSNQYANFVCIVMPIVTAGYGRRFDFIMFLGIFIHK